MPLLDGTTVSTQPGTGANGDVVAACRDTAGEVSGPRPPLAGADAVGGTLPA
jgi:hypothetical protein